MSDALIDSEVSIDELLPGNIVILVSRSVTGVYRMAMPGFQFLRVEIPAGRIAPWQPPPDTIAVVVASETESENLHRSLAAHSPAGHPAVIVAHRLVDALPGVVTSLGQEIRRLSHVGVESARREALLRREAAEAREAALAAFEHAALAPNEEPLVRLIDLPVDPQKFIAGQQGVFYISRTLPVKAIGLCAVALHVHTWKLNSDNGARVKLRTVHDGRILGSWHVPGDAVTRPGWLVLDIAASTGPVDESIEVTVELTLHGGEAVGFSLAVPGAGGIETHDHSETELALQLWSLGGGVRFVRSPYWDAADVGLSWQPRSSLPTRLPTRNWEAAYFLSASGEKVNARRLSLQPGARGYFVVPGLDFGGTQALLARVSCQVGSPGKVTASLAVARASEDDALDAAALLAGIVAISPLKHFSDAQQQLDLSLPLLTAGLVEGQLVIAFANDALPTEGFAIVAVEGILLAARRSDSAKATGANLLAHFSTSAVPRGRPAPSIAPGAAGAAFRAPRPSVAAISGIAAMTMDKVVLDEKFQNEIYSHLDIRLANVTVEDRLWPSIKFKFFHDREKLGFEFRNIPSWPVVFKQWPAGEKDAHGDVYRFRLQGSPANALDDVIDENDRKFLLSLLAAMPSVVATIISAGRLRPADVGVWRELSAKAVEWLYTPGDDGVD